MWAIPSLLPPRLTCSLLLCHKLTHSLLLRRRRLVHLPHQLQGVEPLHGRPPYQRNPQLLLPTRGPLPAAKRQRPSPRMRSSACVVPCSPKRHGTTTARTCASWWLTARWRPTILVSPTPAHTTCLTVTLPLPLLTLKAVGLMPVTWPASKLWAAPSATVTCVGTRPSLACRQRCRLGTACRSVAQPVDNLGQRYLRHLRPSQHMGAAPLLPHLLPAAKTAGADLGRQV